MKLIVGLGNQGKEYEKTRHNMGFHYIDYFAEKNNIKINRTKFNGKYSKITINKEEIILLKPESYMNLSGIVIKRFVDFFKIDIKDILIVHDDLDMPLGKIKLRPAGTSAGHNGLKNIEDNLKTQEYKRLKIGISNNKDIDTKDYVLGRPSNEEWKIFDAMNETIYNVISDFLVLTFDELMAKYNRK